AMSMSDEFDIRGGQEELAGFRSRSWDVGAAVTAPDVDYDVPAGLAPGERLGGVFDVVPVVLAKVLDHERGRLQLVPVQGAVLIPVVRGDEPLVGPGVADMVGAVAVADDVLAG